ncbi:MAG: GNAT family N-acetyltransferase, partial [Candidatus Thermoplasmatota archaeon]|nr:GNAT family N-acetyltransferase [Candidatus Thermoplasmatota archaeon]
MEQKWEMRRYKEGDEKGICVLFEKVFGKTMGKTESINHWNWEYKNNPNNRLEIFLATDKNKIVGHYAVIPIKMKIEANDYLTTLSLDTMMHKDYRGQGMFSVLAKTLYKELEKSGIPITYGFPNINSIKGCKKLEWFEIADLPLLVKPINFKTLLYRYIKNRVVSNILGACFNFFSLLTPTTIKKYKNITIKNIENFDKEFD